MADWWGRFTDIAGAFGERIAEEAGFFDVVEEFQKYDDGDMSAADWLRGGVGAAKQALDMPISTMMMGASEVNRLVGTTVRAGHGGSGGVLGAPAGDPWVDYFTGGVTDEQRQAYRQTLLNKGTPEDQATAAARRLYAPAQLSDIYAVTVDKAVNRYGKNIQFIPFAWPYALSGSTDGVQSNQSYLPASFDLWADDAGLQLWEYEPMRGKLVGAQFITEAVVDPMNWLSEPIAMAIAARRATKLISALPGDMPEGAKVAASIDAVRNGEVDQRRGLRMRQMVPGHGTMNPHQMLDSFRDPRMRSVLEQLAQTRDRTQIRRWLIDLRMADGDGASTIATVLMEMDTPEDVAATLYAFAYRDKVATDRVTAKLARVDNFPAANALNTHAGLVHNALEQAPFQFGNGALPEGHLLSTQASKFVDDAIEREFTLMNLPEGSTNPIREQWDALADAERTNYLKGLGRRREVLGTVANKLLDPASSVEFPLERLANPRLSRIPGRDPVALRRLERAAQQGDLRTPVRVASWLEKITPAIKINGRPLRTSASVWLMSRPGLTFSLHGLDAVEKFDDIIFYADGLLGPNPTVADGMTGGRFVEDQVVKDLRDRFVGAGAITRNPEQIRAGLVDELQQLIISRIALNRGASREAADILAEEGMRKSRNMTAELNNIDKGYTTVAIQDYIPVILAGHPTAIRQTANHVPIMDLKAVDDALKSKGLQAYHHPNDLLSVAESKIQPQHVRKELDKYRSERNKLAYVGRSGLVQAGHRITDIADTVYSIFKMEVLYRLGYPLRNIEEAHLSAFASGVPWLTVMAHAGYTPAGMRFMLGNFFSNLHHMPARFADRWKVSRGTILSEDALANAAVAHSNVEAILNGELIKVHQLASNPAELTRLVNLANNGTPEEQAEAVDALSWMMNRRLRAAQHLDPEHPLVKGGVVEPYSAQSAIVHHADTTGMLNGQATPGNLNGPIATVDDRVVAQTRADDSWTPQPDWRTIDLNPTGTGMPGVFDAKHQDLMAVLRVDLVAGGGRPGWQVMATSLGPDGHLWFPTTAAEQEFLSDIDAAIARASVDPTLAVTNVSHLGISPDQIKPMLEHIRVTVRNRPPATPPPSPVRGNWTVEGRWFTDQQQAALLQRYSDMRMFGITPKWRISGKNGNVTITSKEGWKEFMDDMNTAKAGANGADLRVLNEIVTKMENAAKWNVRQKQLAQAARTDHVQYRRNMTGPWVDWPGPLPFRSGRALDYHEFRTIPRPANGGRPAAVPLEVWGPEVNLAGVNSAHLAAMAKNPDLERSLIQAAQRGDRAAQRRVSEVFAKEGIYRVRFGDDPKWNGSQVLIHPNGVGEAGLDRLTALHVEEMIQAKLPPHVDVKLLPRRQRKAIEKGREAIRDVPLVTGAPKSTVRTWNREGTAPADPMSLLPSRPVIDPATGAVKINPKTGEVVQAPISIGGAKDVLQLGGFDAVLEELTTAAAHLRAQREALTLQYLRRRQHVGMITKKKGIPPALWKMQSLYRNFYAMPDHLSGPDSGAFRQLASADMTQVQMYGVAGHNADLMGDLQRAMLNEEELHPGNPRYWEGLANLLGRQYRDMPGAVTPMGVTGRDIDPVFARALERGDRQRLMDETIAWALHTTEGHNWVRGLNLKPAKDVAAAKAAAEAAQARRGKVPILTDGDFRRTVKQNWHESMDDVVVKDVDVADIIRATFAFADSHLPTQAVRDLFTSGNLTADTLRAAYEAEPWELKAFNGLVAPTHPAYREMIRQRNINDNAMDTITEKLIHVMGKGMQKLAAGPETRMARHPVYLAIGKADFQQRITYAEGALGRELTMDEVLRLRSQSQQFALKKMEQTLHTMKSRSSVDDFMRFVFPFFPAWRNSVHRWGKFAMENPGGVAKVGRLYETTVGEMPWYDSATGAEVDPDSADPNESYTLMSPWSLIPKLMHWDDDPIMQEAMRKTRMSKRSFDVIFQGEMFNPGFGPFAAAPVQALMNHFAGLYDSPVGKQVAKWFMPVGPAQTGSQWVDALMTIVPSSLKPIVTAAFNTQGHISTRNRYAQTYYSNGYHLNPDGTTKSAEQIDHEISMATVKLQGIKVLSYLVSPVSAQQVGDQEFYAGQYRSLLEVAPDQRTAEMLFLERYGADRWWYTQSSTSNLTGGMATGQTVANQKANEELAFEATTNYDDPSLLGFTDNLGPDGELMHYDPEAYSPFARNWQMHHNPGTSEQPYRGGKNFAEQQDDAAVALGWRFYDYNMGLLDLQLAQEGWIPNSPLFIKERAARAKNVAAVVSQAVPQWGAKRQVVDTAKTERAADYFTWLVNDSEWVKDPKRAKWAVVDSMRGYLADRETARQMIAENKARNPRAGSTTSAVSNEEVAAWLRTRRELYSQGSASFRDWVDRYFRNDIITYEVNAAEPLEAITQ